MADSSERVKEKIQFAIQGVMDNSNFAIRRVNAELK
jgi:hypothetical protein